MIIKHAYAKILLLSVIFFHTTIFAGYYCQKYFEVDRRPLEEIAADLYLSLNTSASIDTKIHAKLDSLKQMWIQSLLVRGYNKGEAEQIASDQIRQLIEPLKNPLLLSVANTETAGMPIKKGIRKMLSILSSNNLFFRSLIIRGQNNSRYKIRSYKNHEGTLFVEVRHNMYAESFLGLGATDPRFSKEQISAAFLKILVVSLRELAQVDTSIHDIRITYQHTVDIGKHRSFIATEDSNLFRAGFNVVPERNVKIAPNIISRFQQSSPFIIIFGRMAATGAAFATTYFSLNYLFPEASSILKTLLSAYTTIKLFGLLRNDDLSLNFPIMMEISREQLLSKDP